VFILTKTSSTWKYTETGHKDHTIENSHDFGRNTRTTHQYSIQIYRAVQTRTAFKYRKKERLLQNRNFQTQLVAFFLQVVAYGLYVVITSYLPNDTKEQVEILWLVNLSKDRYMLLYAYEAATCSKLTAVCVLIN
jgi:hypothetical protein